MEYQSNITGHGQRDCTERWEHIQKELPNEGVVWDIGSAEGFFVKSIADETNLLAISSESHRKRRKLQASWCAGQKYEGKIYLCHKAVDKSMSSLLSKSCEWFDCILLLSVLHWVKNSDQVLENLSQIASKIIVELPGVDDKNATGQDFIRRMKAAGGEDTYLRLVSGRSVRHLASVKAHTSETRNLWVIEGSYDKTCHLPHVDFDEKSRNYKKREYRKHFDGEKFNLEIYSNAKSKILKTIDSDRWIPGVNVSSLRLMGIGFPEKSWWYNQIENLLLKLPFDAVDVRMHNIIASRDGLKWIDLDDDIKIKPTVYLDIENIGWGQSDIQHWKYYKW